MTRAVRSRLMMFITVAVLALCGGGASTQDEVEPTNDLPNPYQTIATWGKLPQGRSWRSEEHTSELQSRGHLVCRLLLEKKKKIHSKQILIKQQKTQKKKNKTNKSI